ncbi:MAG: DUF1232 domain-containing protein [Endomicrobium sp.]|jgi:uncharacterized membrane protein YkvA (DUF1232 family)|nr:DUF1232 domain-containing protein [Endomicrobium sp.]
MDNQKKDIAKAVPVKIKRTKLAWIILIFAAIYTISPIDIIPDAPVIGWVDDAFVDIIAILNLIIKYRKNYQQK